MHYRCLSPNILIKRNFCEGVRYFEIFDNQKSYDDEYSSNM